MYNFKNYQKMEKLILLLLSVDSINIHSTAYQYVFRVDDTEQNFPTLETKISYLEKFKIRFGYDDFKRLTVFYDYDVEITDSLLCMLEDYRFPLNQKQFNFNGSFVFHEYYFSDLQIPDFSEIRKQIVNDNFVKITSKLEDYCVTLFKANENIINAALKSQQPNL